MTNIVDMNRIIVDINVKKQIKDELGVTYQTIKSALFGMTKTDKALSIRSKALELGGVIYKGRRK